MDGEEIPWAEATQLSGLIAEHEKSISAQTLIAMPNRQEYFKAKKEQKVVEIKQREEGLTQKEQGLLDRFIRPKPEVEDKSDGSDAEEGKDNEDHIEQVSLLVYGPVATEEQILGNHSKSSKRARRKREMEKKLKAEQAEAAAKLEAEKKAAAEEKARAA